MKKFGLFPVLSVIALVFSFTLGSCKKINEATELGGDLIPAVDNINTFEAFLDAETDNVLFNDSSKTTYIDDLAIGAITNDMEFGTTQASAYFNLAPRFLGAYPFQNRDSIVDVDSIVLSLSYQGFYGDTNSTLNVRVFEIDPAADFRDTFETDGIYPVNVPDFPTVGSELGSKSFQIRELNDTLKLVQKRLDTLRTNNVLRIKFNSSALNAFKIRFVTAPDGRTYDSTINYFYKILKGLAVKADMQGNALAYVNLADRSKSALTFYYRTKKENGIIDTTSTDFVHGDQRTPTRKFSAQANVIKRTPGGGYAAALAATGTNDNRLFIQGDPGSAGIIRIPALDTFKSNIIYRAELIVPKLPAQQSNIFPAPLVLFLDKLTTPGDTAYSIADDMIHLQRDSSIDFRSYGGLLVADSAYRWNITAHVQGVISHGQPNSKLRVYLPYKDRIFMHPSTRRYRTVYVSPFIGYGRVILGGGSFADPAKRVRLRLVYSKVR